MKALIQRVTEAKVTVGGEVVGAIGAGMLVFVGVDREDNEDSIRALTERMLKYRLFADEDGKMNLDIGQSGGGILFVSQFTLAADTTKGLRPGFSSAASPQRAKQLFDHAVSIVREQHPSVQQGRFGADMHVTLVNDGPVTFLLQN